MARLGCCVELQKGREGEKKTTKERRGGRKREKETERQEQGQKIWKDLKTQLYDVVLNSAVSLLSSRSIRLT